MVAQNAGDPSLGGQGRVVKAGCSTIEVAEIGGADDPNDAASKALAAYGDRRTPVTGRCPCRGSA
jgi:hypothetical protein